MKLDHYQHRWALEDVIDGEVKLGAVQIAAFDVDDHLLFFAEGDVGADDQRESALDLRASAFSYSSTFTSTDGYSTLTSLRGCAYSWRIRLASSARPIAA